jgi:hypothetical protein
MYTNKDHMFRISISGDTTVFQTLDGISKPQSLKQRVYRWDDCIGTYCPTFPWDKQWSVERRVARGSGVIPCSPGDHKTWCTESVEIPSIRAPPMIVDDVYDENVKMYSIDSHITMLEMKDMCIFIGAIEKLRGLPLDSEIISLLSKLADESSSCQLAPPQQGSLQPLPLSLSLQSLQLAETSRDPRPHQSPMRSHAGTPRPQGREQRGDHQRRSHDRLGHVQQRLPYPASRFRESGSYGPKTPSGAQTATGRPQSQRNPRDREQSHPQHRTAPLSAQPPRVRRPEFVPEEP